MIVSRLWMFLSVGGFQILSSCVDSRVHEVFNLLMLQTSRWRTSANHPLTFTWSQGKKIKAFHTYCKGGWILGGEISDQGFDNQPTEQWEDRIEQTPKLPKHTPRARTHTPLSEQFTKNTTFRRILILHNIPSTPPTCSLRPSPDPRPHEVARAPRSQQEHLESKPGRIWFQKSDLLVAVTVSASLKGAGGKIA